RRQPVTLVALNLDPPLPDRPARATPLLERGGKFQQPGFIEGKIGYGCHALAPSALRLPTQADHGGAGLDDFLLLRRRHRFGSDCRNSRRLPPPIRRAARSMTSCSIMASASGA